MVDSFTASGDMRNLAQTVALLPSEHNKALNVTLNDKDLNVTARNIIILFIALAVNDVEKAVDCMLHVWYSAQLKKSHLELLDSIVRPLIQDMCSKINEKSESALLAKTWQFGNRTFRVTLIKSVWFSVLGYLSVPDGLISSKARDIRAAITLAGQRVDYVDRYVFQLPPGHRPSMMRFREDGILLPFGHSRIEFCIPNP